MVQTRLLLLSIAIFIGFGLAQDENVTTSSQNLETRVLELNNAYLRDVTRTLSTEFNIFISILSIIAVLFIALATFFGWGELRVLKRNATKHFHKKADETFEELNQEFEKKLQPLEEGIGYLKEIVEREEFIRKASISYVTPTWTNFDSSPRELEHIKRRGFDKIQHQRSYESIPPKTNIVILHLIDDNKDDNKEVANKEIRAFINQSKGWPAKKSMVLILYAAGAVDRTVLKDWNYIIANMPLTLVRVTADAAQILQLNGEIKRYAEDSSLS